MFFSNNELEILKEFITYKQYSKLSKENWNISANFDFVFNLFLKYKLIEQKNFSLAEKINLEITLKTAKQYCKELNTKTSGTKIDLINRIITTNQNFASTLVKNFNVSDYYICTEKGLSIANDYLTEKKHAIIESEKQLSIFCNKKDYNGLINYIDNYCDFKIFEYSNFKETIMQNPQKLLYIKYLNEDIPILIKHLEGILIEKIKKSAIICFLYNQESKKILLDERDLLFNNLLNKFTDYAWKKSFITWLYNEEKELFPNRNYKIKIESIDELCSSCTLNEKLYDLSNMPELPKIDCPNMNKPYSCYYKLIKVS